MVQKAKKTSSKPSLLQVKISAQKGGKKQTRKAAPRGKVPVGCEPNFRGGTRWVGKNVCKEYTCEKCTVGNLKPKETNPQRPARALRGSKRRGQANFDIKNPTQRR